MIFNALVHLSCVSCVGGQTWLVSYFCLSLSSSSSHVLFCCPRNMLRNKIGRFFFLLLPSTLSPFFFALLFLTCHPLHSLFIQCNCAAVPYTHCTKRYNVVCCFWLKSCVYILFYFFILIDFKSELKTWPTI